MNIIHVIPLGDFRDHDCSDACWCSPRKDDEEGCVMIHNAMDGRGEFESGNRLPS